MVRALLVALMCAAAVSAASYVDYSGVKMPQYGGGADYEMGRDPPPSRIAEDYHGHSPDAPASLDYKYEEKPRLKTEKPSKDSDDLDVWRKSGRKQRELLRPTKSDHVVRNKYEHDDDDEMPKFTTNRRFSKRRSRLKNEIDQTEEEATPRRVHKPNRDRKDDVSDIDRKDYLHLDKDYISEDKNKEFDDDVKFVREVTNKRSNRRKPREREFKRPKEDVMTENTEEPWPDVPLKAEPELEKDSPFRHDSRRQRPVEMHTATERERGREREGEREHDRYRERVRYQADVEEDDDVKEYPSKAVPGKFKPKAYDEYDDYYDMKRVHNIKNKLPSLLHRSTARIAPPTKAWKMDINKLGQLLKSRRMMATDSSTAMKITRTNVHLFKPSPSSTTTVATTLSTNIDTTAELKTTELQTSTESSSEIESRISILKKIQRKESKRFRKTEKPPVLMQVSNQIATVVMVEPLSSTRPWVEYRDVAIESPKKLDLVKKLMRHKLVAEAKSINDLTDNWDEMVCDYVDTSLLTGIADGVLKPTLCLYIMQLFVFFMVNMHLIL